MASKTQVTERIRRKKVARKGRERKRILRRDGSTKSAARLFGDE